MRKLSVFNFATLNGFFEGAQKGDISWHRHGGEEAEFSAENLKSGNTLLLGRVTYELMANFWPTPAAMESLPIVAKGMNSADKIVFSKTLKKAGWNNTRLVKDNIVEEIRRMKQSPGPDMTILGSGTILTLFAGAGLIDGYQFMIDPVAIGQGTPMFKGIKNPLNLKLVSTKVFSSGTVLLDYEPL